MPQNPLSAFNGQNPMGNWQFMVNDTFAADGGMLQGWTLEICTQGTCTTHVTILTATTMGNTVAGNSITTQNMVSVNGAAVVLRIKRELN